MSSSVPNAVPAFLSIAQAALPAGFQVKLGTIVGIYVSPQTLLVTGVHFTRDDPEVLGPNYEHEEDYSISCSLCSTAGGQDDQASRMSEVYGLYKDIMIAIASNPNLNSTVRTAWTHQLDYTPTYDGTKGWSVGALRFEVQCTARVNPLS